MSPAFWISFGLLWALVAVETVLLFGLLLELGRIRLGQPSSIARDGLGVGETVPPVKVRVADGPLDIAAILGPNRTLLLCALPDCPYCGPVSQAVKDVLAEDAKTVGVMLVNTKNEHPYVADEHLDVAVIDADTALRRLKVRAYPFAYVVARDGRVLSQGLVNTKHDVLKILGRAATQEKRLKTEVNPTTAIA